MDLTHWQVIFALSIGGVTIGLPFVLIKSIRVPPIKWAAGVGLAIIGSVAFSAIVAAGGKCGFFETLLIQNTGCNNLPFANTRTVPVLNALALICFLLLIIEIIRLALASVFFGEKR